MAGNKNLRLLSVLLVALALLATACPRDDNEDTTDREVEVTEAPEETPQAQAVGDFQLVGDIDEAFQGAEPDIDLPAGGVEDDDPVDATAEPGESPGVTPAATDVGATPPEGGILRLSIDDLSDELAEACNLEADDTVEVYWTVATRFEPAEVVDDIEDEIEDRTAGLLGEIYRRSGGEDDDDQALEETAEPVGSPGVTPGDDTVTTASPDLAVETDCILVASQIGFTTTTLPTPRPRTFRPRTEAPAARPVRTATPVPTATATPTRTVRVTPRPTVRPPVTTPTRTP